jgi:3-hydroxy-5-methyl-1-naphthoate 3-O-methyltransferase
MLNKLLQIPAKSPARIFTLRDSSFAADLFIAAVSRLDFFNCLAKSPLDFASICRTLEIKPRPADVMLTLFKAYGFIREKEGKYHLTDLSRSYLIHESGFDLSSYVSSLADRPVCRDMIRTLRTGKPANWAGAKNGQEWATSMENEAFAESFTSGMNNRGAYLARGVAKALDLTPYHAVLDIGGASGIYSAVLVQKYPHLHAAVFERPPVDKAAGYTIDKLVLSDKVDIVAGDIFRDSLPQGYDVHFLSHVLHDWDLKEVKSILKNSFANLTAGGKIIIHDAHINQRKTGPVSVAEYSVLLMLLSRGKCYSVTEMKDLLVQTGFRDVQYHPAILNRSIITATK